MCVCVCECGVCMCVQLLYTCCYGSYYVFVVMVVIMNLLL